MILALSHLGTEGEGAKNPEFFNLCCGIKLLFNGYFIMEQTVLGLWPRVKVAQVLPTPLL